MRLAMETRYSPLAPLGILHPAMHPLRPSHQQIGIHVAQSECVAPRAQLGDGSRQG